MLQNVLINDSAIIDQYKIPDSSEVLFYKKSTQNNSSTKKTRNSYMNYDINSLLDEIVENDKEILHISNFN